jgi:hypothetical protein
MKLQIIHCSITNKPLRTDVWYFAWRGWCSVGFTTTAEHTIQHSSGNNKTAFYSYKTPRWPWYQANLDSSNYGHTLGLHVVHVDGVRLCLWTAATNRPVFHPADDNEYGEPRWNDIDRGKPKNSDENQSESHFFHHIPHGLTGARTRASAMRGRWLTAWAMARITYSAAASYMTFLLFLSWNVPSGYSNVTIKYVTRFGEIYSLQWMGINETTRWCVAIGCLVISVLVTGPKVHGFISSQGR